MTKEDQRKKTYRQFTNTHQMMIRAIDPSSLSVIQRCGGEQTDLPPPGMSDRRRSINSEAVLRLETVTRTRSSTRRCPRCTRRLVVSGGRLDRPRDLEPATAERRPAARERPRRERGHAKGNAPGAVDHLFYGYYAQAATMVKDERGQTVPELVRGALLGSPP